MPIKALLVLDNAPSHPSIDELADGDIKAKFVPPDVTAICQPMDQGVLAMMKKKYRRRILHSLISATDKNEDYITITKRD